MIRKNCNYNGNLDTFGDTIMEGIKTAIAKLLIGNELNIVVAGAATPKVNAIQKQNLGHYFM